MYLSSIFSFFFLSTSLHFCFGNPYSVNDKSAQQCYSNSNSRLVGTLVPVFTPADEYSNVEYSTVTKYVDLLCDAGINGVILFSVQTAGPLCTLEEKKLLVKTWLQEAKRCDLVVICQVGEAVYNETLALASYCKEAGADAIISSPASYLVSDGVEGVVEYIAAIAQACYPKPFIYSDLEFDCNFDYNTGKVFRAAKRRIKNLAGVKTNYIRALEFLAILGNSDITVITSDSADISGAYLFCLNGTSTLIANIFPKQVVRIVRAVLNHDYATAISIEKRINRVYFGCLDTYRPDRIDRSLLSYKIQIDRFLMYLLNGIDLGKAPTPPLPKLSRDQMMQCYRICKREGVAIRNPLDRNDKIIYPNKYPNDIYRYYYKYSDPKYDDSIENNNYNNHNKYDKYNDENEYNEHNNDNEYIKYNDDNEYNKYDDNNEYNKYNDDNEYNTYKNKCLDNDECNAKYLDDQSGNDNDADSNENKST